MADLPFNTHEKLRVKSRSRWSFRLLERWPFECPSVGVGSSLLQHNYAVTKPGDTCLQRYQAGSGIQHCLIYSSWQSVAIATPVLCGNKCLLSTKWQHFYFQRVIHRRRSLKTLCLCYDQSILYFFFVNFLNCSQMDDKLFHICTVPSGPGTIYACCTV